MCDPDSIEHASGLWLTVITIAYMIFAYQIFSYIRWEFAKRKTVISVGSVAVVFVFCGLSGYATSVLPASWWAFRDVLHAILSFAILAVVWDRKAAHAIAQMMEHDID